ncbi:MAG: hypothetical protein P4L84_17960 [Isosphaeraceae bacterium]|nr:hypothetical protein [Isosphaeraceae bacterium]
MNQQASSAIAAHSPINDTARADANNAARLGLFKQYHNGLAPGEFQAMQRAQQLQGPYDPFRDRMVQQASHPAYLNQGGTASYRGVVPFDGPSIADRNTEIANNAGSRVAAYDLAKSQARAADPYTQLDVAGELARDRSKAGAMIAINRGDPNLANAIPASTEGESEPMRNPSADLFSGAIGHAGSPRANNPINAANFEEILAQNPATRDLGEMLGKAETPLHEKAQYFASTPGANDPNSPVRQAWDAFMNSQLARGQAFQNELGQYNPLGEGHSSAPTHQSLVSRILGINPEWSPGNLLRQAMGYQQAETFRNQQFADNMAKLGYAPANNGVRSVPLFGAVQ